MLLVVLWNTAAGVALGLSFVSIILEALPFVMLGSLLGGLFEVFVPREWIVRLLPRRKIFAILVAASLGLLLPVCECAVIPFTRRLVRKGRAFFHRRRLSAGRAHRQRPGRLGNADGLRLELAHPGGPHGVWIYRRRGRGVGHGPMVSRPFRPARPRHEHRRLSRLRMWPRSRS